MQVLVVERQMMVNKVYYLHNMGGGDLQQVIIAIRWQLTLHRYVMDSVQVLPKHVRG